MVVNIESNRGFRSVDLSYPVNKSHAPMLSMAVALAWIAKLHACDHLWIEGECWLGWKMWSLLIVPNERAVHWYRIPALLLGVV